MGGSHELKARIAYSAASVIAAALMAQAFTQEAYADSKGTIVAFIISSTNPYIGQWRKGAEAKAKELGYNIKIIENNFNQTEEDSQVQQELASGEKAAGYIWWPMQTRLASILFARCPKTGAPVILTNQYPVKGSDAYWTAYAGASDILSGKTAGELLLAACAKQRKSNVTRVSSFAFPPAIPPATTVSRASMTRSRASLRRSTSFRRASSWKTTATRSRRRSSRPTRTA